MITSQRTPQGADFKDIPPVNVLYITAYDALGNGQTVTPVKRCQKVKDKYEPLNDGEDILFANTEVKDNTKHTKMLQLFLRKDSFYEEDYPALSEAMHHFKETEEGVSAVCEIIEEYGAEVYKKGIEQIIMKKLKKGLSVSEIADFLEMPEEQVEDVEKKMLRLV